MSTIAHLIEDRRVIACVGSGGVGKTTTAAALALYGASIGKRALVITIDPARRLANSLGIDELMHAPSPVDEKLLVDAGLPAGSRLDAMMLDLQAAWDDMVRRTAHSDAYAARIFENRFYGYLSRELPGAHDFIACEALDEISSTGKYDLIVLDTPPTTNALDFLDAPDRILSFLDNDSVKLFARTSGAASRLGLRFLDGAAGVAQALLSRVAGADVIEELSDFLWLIRDLYEPLSQRVRSFQKLVASDASRFLIIASADPGPAREAMHFHRLLVERQLPIGGVLVNRVTAPPALDQEQLERELREAGREDLTACAQRVLKDAQFDADRDAAVVDLIRKSLPADLPLVSVRRRSQDVYDVGGLVDLLTDLAP